MDSLTPEEAALHDALAKNRSAVDAVKVVTRQAEALSSGMSKAKAA